MKQLFTAALLLSSLHALAADSTGLRHTKRLSIVVRLRGVGLSSLNQQVMAADYPPFPISYPCFSVSQGTYFPSGWGYWYNGSYGGVNKKEGARSMRSETFEASVGAGYQFVRQRYLIVTGTAGFWFGGLNLRLYDDASDTISFSHYLNRQPADTKRFAAQQGGFTVGLELQPRLPSFFDLVAGGGYSIPFTPAAFSHDGGNFRRAPLANVSTWYLQAGLLFQWGRYEQDQQEAPYATFGL